MTNTFWAILHSIVWNGEISRDEDLPFPLNIISQIWKGDKDATINLKDAESKEDTIDISAVSNANYYDGHKSSKHRLSGSSLSEISLNNLVNFVTDPEIAAGSLVISAALVNVLYHQCFLVYYTNLKCQYLLRKLC